MGISGKFIVLLFAGCLIPLTAIFTNLDDWLNNRQNLELYKERNRYHNLGKSFEALFSLYLKGINALSSDYSKALDKKYFSNKKKNKAFSRVNSDPSYWTNGYPENKRFYSKQFKKWDVSRKAKFLGENLFLKTLLDKTVNRKLTVRSNLSEWEDQSPALHQVFALEKNFLPGKSYTYFNFLNAPQLEIDSKIKRIMRIQPLIYHSDNFNQEIWDQLSGMIWEMYGLMIDPHKPNSESMDEILKYLGIDDLINSRGKSFPISAEVVEILFTWNTIPSTFNIDAYMQGESDEEIPDCIVVNIVLLQKARNRFLEAWLDSELHGLFNRIDPSNQLHWKSKLQRFKDEVSAISRHSKIVFFDSLGIQPTNKIEVVTLNNEPISLKSLQPQYIEHLYNDNGQFGTTFTESLVEDKFSKLKTSKQTPNVIEQLLSFSTANNQNIDFNGSFKQQKVIGSLIQLTELPSTTFLILRNSVFLENLRTRDLIKFLLLMIFLAAVSLKFYFLLHKQLVKPVTKLSDSVLQIRPGSHISLNASISELNHELQLLHTEFEELQSRMNLDYDSMQLSRKLLAVCNEKESQQIRLILARELCESLGCKAVCLGLYRNGVSRRTSDYASFSFEQNNLGETLKRQWLQEIQLQGKPDNGLANLPGTDSYRYAFQLHLMFDEETGIGTLMRLYEPDRVDLIESGRLEMVLVQLIPPLIRQEINDLSEEQQMGSELQSRFQVSNINIQSLDYNQVYLPARSLAGDALLSWQSSDKKAVYVAIGDAAGKGVGPSLYSATCVSLLRPMAVDLVAPGEILSALNNTLCEYNSDDMFLTFFLARIDLTTYEIQYASAGHNKMLLCKANGDFIELSAMGMPLGIISDGLYQIKQTTLEIGDRLFLYTDGVTEAEDIYQELFGTERLLGLLSKNQNNDSQQTLNSIKTQILEFTSGLESSDDISMISLLRKV